MMDEMKQEPIAQTGVIRGVIALCVLALLAGALAIVIMRWGGNAARQSPLRQSAQDILSGDYESAQRGASQLISERKDVDTAKFILESANFAMGGTEERLQAIRGAQAAYLSAATPQEKSIVINRLREYGEVSTAYPDLFKEIFTAPAFKTLFVEGNMAASLKNLAQLSLSFSTTTAALFQIAEWKTVLIIAERDDPSTRFTEKDVQNAEQRITQLVQEADQAYMRERNEPLAFPALFAQQFFAKRGLVLGAAALVKREHLSEAERSLEQAIKVYSDEQARGNDSPIIEASVPSLYLNRAAFVDAIVGSSRKADVLSYIRAALRVLKEHPERHEHYFIANLKNIGASRPFVGLWLDKKRLTRLAELEPEFKSYLTSLGWKFE